MILEGIMTTLDADETVNISPMGPIVSDDMQEMLFRPFQTSRTYQNLKRDRHGVFHVTDNVEMIARAAVGQLEPPPSMIPTTIFSGRIIDDACRWYAVEVTSLDDSQQRAEITTRVVDQGRLREFFGLNRAKHAVVEIAILATRVHLLPMAQIREDVDRLAVLIEKTGGAAEQAAFAFLDEYIRTAAVKAGSPD
ncbi:MAG: DUF447 domain-containing protein [Pirellulales bacterium]